MHTMEVDGVALNPSPGLQYFSGLHFHLSERPVVFLHIPGRLPAIILPKLELTKLETISLEISPFPYNENPEEWKYAFRDACSALGIRRKRIGIDPGAMRLLEHSLLKQAAGDTLFQDAAGLISTPRLTKSSTEIQSIEKAVVIAQSALEATLPQIRCGMSERELASELFIQLLKNGSDPSLPFMPIVASGPNSANPHAVPTERCLQPGDALVIDWGASCDGYVSDLTRTFAVGEATTELKEVHDIVHRANRVGRHAGKSGIACAEVDRAARSTIEEAGYGPFFTHRTGHGIGLECHEAPYLRDDNKQLLVTGMTYTVEPGIYLAGRLGVRIEDDIVVTDEGSVSLSTMDRSLQVVG